MATKRREAVKPRLESKPFSFMERLQEIGVFFQKRSPQHQTLRRLARRLKKAGIPYALMGAMAVNAHGAERTTNDVDILLTATVLERFRQEFVDAVYEQVEGRPRRFIERKSGVMVDCLITGRYPGSGQPGPFAFPDPAEASQEIDKISVLTLPQLIQLKLAARRHYDFGDVVFLIRIHNLDESFLSQLHPSVHRDFIGCLDEKRREDDYLAREGRCHSPLLPLTRHPYTKGVSSLSPRIRRSRSKRYGQQHHRGSRGARTQSAQRQSRTAP